MTSPPDRRYRPLIRWVVHLLCLMPLLWLIHTSLTSGLGANPIEYAMRYLGDWTLRMLLITLTFSPAARLLHQPDILLYRRAAGLYVFFYALLHFLSYAALDQFFDWFAIREDIVDRPYILVGFFAFVLLWPLMATSNQRAVAWLQHRWKSLHRLVYLVAVAGLLHYWWLVRADFAKAWLYLILLALLFSYRVVVHIKRQRS